MPRITLDLHDETDELVVKLKHLFKSSSKADVFRKALALLDLAVEARENGGQIAIVDKDERVHKILLT